MYMPYQYCLKLDLGSGKKFSTILKISYCSIIEGDLAISEHSCFVWLQERKIHR